MHSSLRINHGIYFQFGDSSIHNILMPRYLFCSATQIRCFCLFFVDYGALIQGADVFRSWKNLEVVSCLRICLWVNPAFHPKIRPFQRDQRGLRVSYFGGCMDCVQYLQESVEILCISSCKISNQLMGHSKEALQPYDYSLFQGRTMWWAQRQDAFYSL